MADTNPANFANLPKERVQEIASMGGKAAHEKAEEPTHENEGRAPTGEFLPGSEAAKEAGHKGGLHAQGKKTEEEIMGSGRDEEGKFVPGSEAAKAAGHKGGIAAAANNGN